MSRESHELFYPLFEKKHWGYPCIKSNAESVWRGLWSDLRISRLVEELKILVEPNTTADEKNALLNAVRKLPNLRALTVYARANVDTNVNTIDFVRCLDPLRLETFRLIFDPLTQKLVNRWMIE